MAKDLMAENSQTFETNNPYNASFEEHSQSE